MTIDVEDRGGIKILHLEGDLDSDESVSLVQAATDALQGRGARAVIDMSGVSHLSSAGIGALVRVTAQANTQEQSVALASPTPFVAGVFMTSRLDKFFSIYPSVDAAIDGLQTDMPARDSTGQ